MRKTGSDFVQAFRGEPVRRAPQKTLHVHDTGTEIAALISAPREKCARYTRWLQNCLNPVTLYVLHAFVKVFSVLRWAVTFALSRLTMTEQSAQSQQQRLLEKADKIEVYHMVVRSFFPWGGATVVLFGGDKNNFWIFFQGGGNSGEISFYQLEAKRKTSFYWNVNRKISNFKIQGVNGPCPLPTPIVLSRCQRIALLLAMTAFPLIV